MSGATQQQFNSKYTAFTNDFNSLTGNITSRKDQIPINQNRKNQIINDIINLNSSPSPPNYDTIMNTYNSNLALRTKLDEHLQELYGSPGSINDIFTQQYDATMYMSIVWSILATSLLYFVFIKL